MQPTLQNVKAEFKEFEVKYLLDDHFDAEHFFHNPPGPGLAGRKNIWTLPIPTSPSLNVPTLFIATDTMLKFSNSP